MTYSNEEQMYLEFFNEVTKYAKMNEEWFWAHPIWDYSVLYTKALKNILDGNYTNYCKAIYWGINNKFLNVHNDFDTVYVKGESVPCTVYTSTGKLNLNKTRFYTNVKKIRLEYDKMKNPEKYKAKEVFNDVSAVSAKLIKKNKSETEFVPNPSSSTTSDKVVNKVRTKGKRSKYDCLDLIRYFNVGDETTLVCSNIMNYLGCSDETARKLRYDLITDGYIKEIGYNPENNSQKLYKILRVPA